MKLLSSRAPTPSPDLLGARAGLTDFAKQIQDTDPATANADTISERILSSIRLYNVNDTEYLAGRIDQLQNLNRSIDGLAKRVHALANENRTFLERCQSALGYSLTEREIRFAELKQLVEPHIKKALDDRREILNEFGIISALFAILDIDFHHSFWQAVQALITFLHHSEDRLKTLFYEIHPDSIYPREIDDELSGCLSQSIAYSTLKLLVDQYIETDSSLSKDLKKALASFTRHLEHSAKVSNELLALNMMHSLLGDETDEASKRYYRYRVETLAYKIETLIASLDENESFLIPSGWQGHATVHEIRKEPAQKKRFSKQSPKHAYTLIVNNGGDNAMEANLAGRNIFGKAKELFSSVKMMIKDGTLTRTSFHSLTENEIATARAIPTILQACAFETNKNNGLHSLYKALRKKRTKDGINTLQMRGSCTYNSPRIALQNFAEKIGCWDSLETFLKREAVSQLDAMLNKDLINGFILRMQFSTEAIQFIQDNFDIRGFYYE